MSKSMCVGTVTLFDGLEADKACAVKVLEEAAEAFGAWQRLDAIDFERRPTAHLEALGDLLDECADVVQATCNLAAACDVNGYLGGDFNYFMDRCEMRNRERGRIS